MSDSKSPSLETLAVHAGTRLEGSRSQPIVPPIHVSAVSYFDSADELDRSLDGQDFVYNRINAQATALLEDAVAKLERAEDCVAYASGMAALKAVLDAQPLKAGDRVVMPSDGYGVTRLLFKTSLAEKGVELHALPQHAPDIAAQLAELRPRLVFAESITNPLLTVPDLRALIEASKKIGATVAVDATFASPMLQRPVEQAELARPHLQQPELLEQQAPAQQRLHSELFLASRCSLFSAVQVLLA